jgi:hypothetical protein
MEYGAIDLHAKESQIRIIDQEGAVLLERRVTTTRARTWLYFDPQHGQIVLKEERLARANRWLYHGLHSLDFPVLYNRRPAWDIVVIVLSLGGIAVSITTLWPAWRRLRRRATEGRARLYRAGGGDR